MASKRNLKDNNRRTKNKKRKKLIIIGAEGSNVTEATYFKHFSSSEVKIKIANGNSTDPVGMVSDIVKSMQHRGIDTSYHDVVVFCVLDTDDNSVRWKEIVKATPFAEENGIQVITSTPCFEDWFLCHFEMTTAPLNSKKLIERLKKYISDYDKNLDVYPILISRIETAIKNAKQQAVNYNEQSRAVKSSFSNPSTDVYKIIEEII